MLLCQLYLNKKGVMLGTALAVQWLGLCASIAGGTGSIPSLGTPQVGGAARNRKKKGRERCSYSGSGVL